MKYFSTFSGIGGFELALEGHECIGYSEILEPAIKIYQKHFPNHKNYGDITKINPTELPDFDLFVGGFPCQSFSIAGKRGGFKETFKGKLIYYKKGCMSLTKIIPKKMREEMAVDPFYQRCCISGARKAPGVKIEWHHNFTSYQYGNKGRLNEKWAILPVCEAVHLKAGTSEIKERLDWVMLNRTDDETLKKYSKAEDLIRKRSYLNNKFGKYHG